MASPTPPSKKPVTPGAAAKVRPEDLAFLAPAEQPDELGRLGGYRILSVLGRGGMGLVLKAEDVQLRRAIALKVMLPAMAQKPSARERFLREARAAALLEHDHIIPIFQVGEERGIPFIAMPFLKGMSLDDWLKQRRPLTIPQILRLGREIAKGLQAAHERGLIHRDIKPANLWLDATANGRIKILDFGLARPEKEETHLTRDGQIVGTPQYMAPEQAAGQPIDGRADLFSLGAVLYRLATGTLPFTGENVLAIITALATKTPPAPRELNSDVPPTLSDLIMKLLAKEAKQRPASGKEVVESIAAIERDRLKQGGAVPAVTQIASISQIATPSQIFNVTDSTDSLLSDEDLASVVKKPKKGKRKAKGMPGWAWGAIGGGAAALLALVVILVVVNRPRIEPNLPVDPGASAKDDAKKVNPPAAVRSDPPAPALFPLSTENAVAVQARWAQHLKTPVVETNSVGMKLVLIPPGDFWMGQDTPTFPERGPRHKVRLTYPFRISAHEVTQAQYTEVTGKNPARFTKEKGGSPDHPIEMVAWDDAERFCRLLSELDAEKKAKRRYRLPTEAEWEYAARAGREEYYALGDGVNLPPDLAHISPDPKAPLTITAAVGKFPANAWGLCDVHGNVAEWCNDWYAADYYKESPRENPSGPTEGSGHVQRGAAYTSGPGGAVLTSRKGVITRTEAAGFRIVCEMGEQKVALPPQVDIPQLKPLATLACAGHTTWGLAFTPDGGPIALFGSGGHRAWEPQTWKQRTWLPPNLNGLGIAFSPDQSQFVVHGIKGSLRVFDAKGAPLKTLTEHTSSVSGAVYSPNGQWLATGSGDKDRTDCNVRLWRLPEYTPAELAQPEKSTNPFRQLAISADSRYLAAGSWGNAYLWDLTQPTRIPTTLPGSGHSVRAVAFAPDGKTLATGSEDKQLRLWNPVNGSRLGVHDLGLAILWLRFSPNGKVLAVCGDQGELGLWDAHTLKPLVQLPGHTKSVWCCDFSADGKLLVSGGYDDGGVRLWNVSAFTK